jgi:hypothetical protein
MGDKSDELMSVFNLNFSDLRFLLRSKFDYDHHQLLEEWANKLTNGNLSSILRITSAIGLQQIEKAYKGDVPAVVIAAMGRRKWVHKQNVRRRLCQAAMELQESYDPDYEEAMKKYAEEEGLKWPPDEFDKSEFDPSLKRVMDRLRAILVDNKSTTLRDVYHGMSGMTAADARSAIVRLEEMGVVSLQGSKTTGGSLQIQWADVQKVD